jgi:hypothetical protein
VAGRPFRTFGRSRDLADEVHTLAGERKDVGFRFHADQYTRIGAGGRFVSRSTLNPLALILLKL